MKKKLLEFSDWDLVSIISIEIRIVKLHLNNTK